MSIRVLTVLSAAEGELPLWKELWLHFLETYFYHDTVYEHLNMNGASFATVRNVILGLLVGLCLAAFASVFNKRVWGDFVRLLLREGCLSPEAGKTLPELNSAHKLLLRYGVRRSVNLRRVVRCREEEEYLRRATEESADTRRKSVKPFRVDPDAHHFYIPEEIRYTADVKFEKKGSTWMGALLIVGIMIVVGFLILLFLPDLLSLLNDFVGAFGSGGSDQILT